MTPSPSGYLIPSNIIGCCSNMTATAPAVLNRLALVPKDKIVVLGLVTTKSSDLESLDELKRRIDQASRYLPLEQLGLSPQCGFGGIDSKMMSEDEMWRKLDRIVETARQVWG